MKLINAFVFAINGLKICFTSETNFRIHCLFATAAILLGLTFGLSNIEWLAVLFSIAFVGVIEMVNTAIEKLCDVVQKDIHPGIRKVKDIAAGAVLLAAICSLVTGAIIFLPKIVFLIKSFYK